MMQPQLEYINQGRGGYVVYKDEQGVIKMSFEFGGGNCVVIIFVPSSSNWTKETQRPLADRRAILTFVAEQSIKYQVSNGYYELSENWIEIFKKEST